MNSDSSLTHLDLTEREAALAAEVLDIVRYAQKTEPSPEASTERFALFSTEELLESRPEFSAILPQETIEQARGDRNHLTSIQSPVHFTNAHEELVNAEWPEGLSGGYIHAHIDAEINSAPFDQQPSTMFAAAGALLTGETFTVIDLGDGSPLRVGKDLIPELVGALCASLGME